LDFETYYPEDDECFNFLLSVIVGIKGAKSEESFNVEVCTPKWMMANYPMDDIILGKNKIIVFQYNKENIFKRIKSLFDGRNGNTWEEIALKLSRIGQWEFEDYQK
jgi:hypothetical protein